MCWATLVLLIAGACFILPAASIQGTEVASTNFTGPTLWLGEGQTAPLTNSVGTFMYFVPLISPEPVSAVTSPGSTQAARITGIRRRQAGSTFTTTCDFEFTGQGSQQSIFDYSQEIQRHERELKAGHNLERQLRSITVAGPGHGQVEVQGTLSNGVPTVTRVRLHFNAQGQSSPVSISLSDIRYTAGAFQPVNEVVARVNSLTFRRQAGPPKMEVTVASVKNKGAGNNLWQNFKGGLKGAAVNLLIQPLDIEAAGQAAMFDFGQALITGASSFTFPHARNLRSNVN